MLPAIILKNQNRLLTLVSLLFLLLSLLLGLKLVSERQLINKRASVTSGPISVSLSGPTSVEIGQTLPVTISFSGSLPAPATDGLTSIGVKLTYPNTSVVANPTIQKLLNDPDGIWSFQIRNVTSDSTTTTIEIGAVYPISGAPSPNGYIPNPSELLARLNFAALAPGNFTLTFNPTLSIFLTHSGTDVLSSNFSSQTYTVTGAATPTPIPASVSITDFAFTPQNLTINVGDTVTWANNSSSLHTITSDSSLWDSGNLNPGQIYSRTFSSAGTFQYHCSVHPAMTGSITVLAAPTPTPTPVVTATNTPGPAEPNNCGGTCGSNYNCQGGLACFYDPNLKQKYCRNPLDPQSLDCTIRPATPTPTRRPARTTPRPTATPTPTFTPYEEISPTPTIELLPPDEEYAPPAEEEPTPPQSPFLTRILIIGGTWLLVFLLIIWLIKKYLDSRAKDKTVSDLVNRFKTPEPPARNASHGDAGGPAPPAPPTPPAPPAVP